MKVSGWGLKLMREADAEVEIERLKEEIDWLECRKGELEMDGDDPDQVEAMGYTIDGYYEEIEQLEKGERVAPAPEYDSRDAWADGRHTLALDDTLAWVRETGRIVKRAQIRSRIEGEMA
jgi:hypothetical protein